MVELKPIGEENVWQFKTVRLAALLDSPMAFGSTHAREVQLSDLDWMERAVDWTGDRSAGYLAFDGEIACGIAAGFLEERDFSKARLVSMWVSPTHRRLGVGRLLIDAVEHWAFGCGARSLLLHVTSSNETGIRFYQRLGFAMTGNTDPYVNDPTLVMLEMEKVIGSAKLR